MLPHFVSVCIYIEKKKNIKLVNHHTDAIFLSPNRTGVGPHVGYPLNAFRPPLLLQACQEMTLIFLDCAEFISAICRILARLCGTN